jgi:hypothetical protein
LQKYFPVGFNGALGSDQLTLKQLDQVVFMDSVFLFFLYGNVCLTQVIFHVSQEQVLVK